MYGFIIFNNPDVIWNDKNGSIIRYGNYTFFFNSMNKFRDDKLFYEDNTKVVILDGVILNKLELINKYGNDNWRVTYNKLLDQYPGNFMDYLRGSFCGVVYRKNDNQIIGFTNHTGERACYYYMNGDDFVITSHIYFLKRYLCTIGKELIPNKKGIYELLLTGSCLNDNTPFMNYHRITAGKKIVYNNGSIKRAYYHLFKNMPEVKDSLGECIEKADDLFRKAINRIGKKNIEYGYDFECDLSGGLDSRLVTWIAHDMGYKNLLNVCYCSPGKIDHVVSKKIAHDLGNNYFFLPMDGKVLEDIDNKITLNGGQVDYIVSTGALSVFQTINMNNIGMTCTGLMGEVLQGFDIVGLKQSSANYYPYGLRSDFFNLKIPDEYKDEYDNMEQMLLYEVSTKLYLGSAFIRQQICEVVSPFCDPDFVDYVYKIPLKWRQHSQFSLNWIYRKYPTAAKYLWQHSGKTVKDSLFNTGSWKYFIPKTFDIIRGGQTGVYARWTLIKGFTD